MTRLRQRVLDELQRRNYSPATTRGYILAIKPVPYTLLGESTNCLVHRGANQFPRKLTSREFVPRKPASEK